MLAKMAPRISKNVENQCTFRFARKGLLIFVSAVSVSLVLQFLPLNGGTQPSETTESSTPGSSNSSNAKSTVVVNIKEYGAVGDGVTDDTAAFIKALAACAEGGGGTCLVPEGTYLISSGGISTGHHKPSVLSGVHLKGAGQRAVLKIAGMPTDHFLPCDGDNWSVENLTFDMGDYTPPKFAAISCKGNNWRVSNCAIVKSGKWGIAFVWRYELVHRA